MKRLLVCLALMTFGLICDGQNAPLGFDNFSHQWNAGSIYFRSGDTLNCSLRYNLSGYVSILQILIDGKAVTITANSIYGFSFYDASRERVRDFLSMQISPENEHYQLLESIYADQEVALLVHKGRGRKFRFQHMLWPISKPGLLIRKYIYQPSSGALLPLSRDNFFRALGDDSHEVENFMAQHHLRFRRTIDYVQALKYRTAH